MLRKSSFGDSEADIGSMEEEIEFGEENKSKLKFQKNILKLNMLVNGMVIDANHSHLYIGGANTPIMKYSIESGKSVKETPMPIHCAGIAIDSKDCVWVHNLNNFKLIKFSPELEILKEWEGNEKVSMSKNIFKRFYLGSEHTVSLAKSKKEIAWFRGDNEVLIIDSESNEEIEDLGYFANQCDVIGKIALIDDSKKLLTLTFDKSKQSSYLNSFDVDSERIIFSEPFKDLIGKKIKKIKILKKKVMILFAKILLFLLMENFSIPFQVEQTRR